MAMCPECGSHYREPEDEQGQHPCPCCGSEWWDNDDEEEETTMTLVEVRDGNAVSWAVYDDADEAREAARQAERDAETLQRQGRDFGLCRPGEVQESQRKGRDVWVVTLP